MDRRLLLRALAPVLAGSLALAAPTPVSTARPDPASVDSSTAVRVVDGWRTGSARDLDFRPRRLERLRLVARDLHESSCYAVIRRNRLVAEGNWGTPRTQGREVFSVTKSVLSALVGIAVRDGDLALDDKVARHVKAWRGTPSRHVTVRHLLSNDSGREWSMKSDYDRLLDAPDRTTYAVRLNQAHTPGTAWAYNNAAIQVLDRVIRRATGTPTDEYAATRLFAPLGMRHSRLTRDGSGRSTNVFMGMQTTCLDLARFGRLYLRQGKVAGKRLLGTRFVARSVGRPSTELNAGYGYLWWLNRYGVLRGATDPVDADGQPLERHEGRLVPGAPARLHAALGFGGQVLMVDRRSRTLVVRLGMPRIGAPDQYGFDTAARVVTWASR